MTRPPWEPGNDLRREDVRSDILCVVCNLLACLAIVAVIIGAAAAVIWSAAP